MTNEEKLKAFWRKGCVPRCFMYFNRQTIPVTDEKFIATYEKYFLEGDDYGMLSGDGLNRVAADFKLKWLGASDSYDIAQASFKAGDLIHVTSKIQLEPPESKAESDHCSVLTGITPVAFSVWTPYQNGTEGLVTLEAKYWIPKGCKISVFQRAADGP